jgi:hypothetical protein
MYHSAIFPRALLDFDNSKQQTRDWQQEFSLMNDVSETGARNLETQHEGTHYRKMCNYQVLSYEFPPMLTWACSN